MEEANKELTVSQKTSDRPKGSGLDNKDSRDRETPSSRDNKSLSPGSDTRALKPASPNSPPGQGVQSLKLPEKGSRAPSVASAHTAYTNYTEGTKSELGWIERERENENVSPPCKPEQRPTEISYIDLKKSIGSDAVLQPEVLAQAKRESILSLGPMLQSPVKTKIPSMLSIIGQNEKWFVSEENLEIDKKALTRGQFANIYKGRFFGLKVAVKHKDETDAKEDIRKEIAVWRCMRHPNIVTFMGATFSKIDGIRIIMEYMPGGDLGTRIKNGEVLPTKEVFGMFNDIMKALAWIHGENCIHRDVKPSNILFCENGCKLSDFRVAQFGPEKSVTSKAKLASLLFIAPEVVMERRCTAKMDVYSLGLSVFFAATSKMPFNDFDKEGILDRW
eukprot:CAMPEP_0184491962 /NCGR_PEP_ID=MMETSP0113_2-20130426/21889_1 /TAXON_ID=91329 /ORGANISM="Norrisiella sphaerica, Strain BC52" /LENGTH=389 /DNA_ID=CAMNT_0026876549 /DNA_START=79 /DNA_END=1245 /DNA_ORIENTATION=+